MYYRATLGDGKAAIADFGTFDGERFINHFVEAKTKQQFRELFPVPEFTCTGYSFVVDDYLNAYYDQEKDSFLFRFFERDLFEEKDFQFLMAILDHIFKWQLPQCFYLDTRSGRRLKMYLRPFDENQVSVASDHNLWNLLW